MSEVRVNKLSPRSGTTVTLGDSGDTITIPSGVTLANSGTIDNLNASNLTSGTVPSARVSGAYNNVTSVGTLTSFASTGIDDNATGTSLTIASDGRTTLDTTNEKPLIVHHSDGDTVRIGMNNNSTNSNEIAFESTDFIVKPGGFEKFRIDSSGNVLVGKTSADYTTAGTIIRSDGALFSTTNGSNTAVFERLTSDGDIIRFEKDNTTVGRIGSREGRMFLHSPSPTGSGIRMGDAFIQPCDSDGSDSDNDTALGQANSRFTDLYLSGGLYVGGTGTANKLDDYEEGTWTPTFINFSGSGGESQPSVAEGHYTKIGNLVYIGVYLQIPANGDSSALVVSNIPFTSKNTTYNIFGGSVTRTDAVISNGVGTLIIDNSNTFYVSETNAGNLIDYSVFSGKYLSMVATYLTDA